MKKQHIAALLLCALILPSAVPVQAAEPKESQNQIETEQSSDQESIIIREIDPETSTEPVPERKSVFSTDYDLIFQQMQESMKKGESISFSKLFNENSTLKITEESMFDMSDAQDFFDADMGMTNLKYEALASALTDSVSQNFGGQSMDCMGMFQDTYGGVISGLEMKEPEIPKGFTVDSMLNAGNNAVNQAYKDAMKSSSFQSVKNQISIGSVFDMAKRGPDAVSLKSDKELSSLLSKHSSSSKSQIKGEYGNRQGWLNDKRSDFKLDLKAMEHEARLNMTLLGKAEKALEKSNKDQKAVKAPEDKLLH